MPSTTLMYVPGLSVRHIGIDLAWGTKSRTGLAEVDGTGALLHSETVIGDEDIEAFIGTATDDIAVVAIDAPIIVANPDGQRPCETQLGRDFGRYGASAHSTNLRNPAFLPETRALRLATRLGWRIDPGDRPMPGHPVAIEVYPHPAMVSLFDLDVVIPYKAKKGRRVPDRVRAFNDLFTRMETNLPVLALTSHPRWVALRDDADNAKRQQELDTVEDEIDAIFCAHLAWLWNTSPDLLTVYGDTTTGYIVTPPPPTPPPRTGGSVSTRLDRKYWEPGQRASPTHRLLDELSWEGNARKYRGGGHRLENVLTAEVFGHLDLLPRQAFLARVLRAATGADVARENVSQDAENISVEVLPGDLTPQDLNGDPVSWRIQPDVLLDSTATFTYVEAKAPHGGRFTGRQLARTLLATVATAGPRTNLVLLVTGEPPPWPVQSHGRLDVDKAIEVGLHHLSQDDAAHLQSEWPNLVAWITWQQIATEVGQALAEFHNDDTGVQAAVTRTAKQVLNAIDDAYGPATSEH